MNAQNRCLDFFFGQLHLIEGCLALMENLTFDSCRCGIQCKSISDNIRWSEMLMAEARREEASDDLFAGDMESFDELLREIHYQLIIVRLQASHLVTHFPKTEAAYRRRLAQLRDEGTELGHLRNRLRNATSGNYVHEPKKADRSLE